MLKFIVEKRTSNIKLIKQLIDDWTKPKSLKWLVISLILEWNLSLVIVEKNSISNFYLNIYSIIEQRASHALSTTINNKWNPNYHTEEFIFMIVWKDELEWDRDQSYCLFCIIMKNHYIQLKWKK